MNISENSLKQINELITDLIPFNICRYHNMLPVSRQETIPPSISVAMVNPENIQACNALKKYLQSRNFNYKKLLISESDYEKLMSLYSSYLLKLNQAKKINQSFQYLDYTNNLVLFSSKYAKNGLQPKPYDLVLGGRNNKSKALNLMVLGGREGVEFRFKSQKLATRIMALHESLKYKNIAINLLSKTLKEETGILVWVAYSLLKNIADNQAQKLLLEYQVKLTAENLSGANLQGLNLKGIDLENADLSNVNFKNTIIDENTKINPKWLIVWKIVNQGLHDCNFEKIELTEANLKGSNITDVILSNSLFAKVDLSDANLMGIDFSLTKFKNVNLENATLNDLKMKSAILTKINFSKANLTQINFQESHLSETNFKRSNLVEVDFSNAYLKQVDFSYAKLTGVNFKDAILNQVNFSDAIVNNIDMSYLNLSSFHLNLNKLDLRNSKFIHTNLKGLNLSGANLSGANLSGANLSDTNLSDTNLDSATLILATYNKNTIFPNNFNPESSGAICC